MEIFINNLRRALNHLSNSEHADFHKVIKQLADKHFSGIKDSQIEEWLNTEELHTRDFQKTAPKDLDPSLADFILSDDDLRADTDRFLFGALRYILEEKPIYVKNLKQFRAEIEPKLATLTLSPDYTIETIDQMPFDAAHLLHVFLAQKLAYNRPIIKRDKILPPQLLQDYINASYSLRQYYSLGGFLFSDSLKDCTRLLQEIYKYLSTYLRRARSRTSSRYETSQTVLHSIDMVISGL